MFKSKFLRVLEWNSKDSTPDFLVFSLSEHDPRLASLHVLEKMNPGFELAQQARRDHIFLFWIFNGFDGSNMLSLNSSHETSSFCVRMRQLEN
jgi:hypothetical protein